MTLYMYSDPQRAFIDALLAEVGRFPTGATVGTSFPSSAITAPHIQVAWDGTPADEQQREFATMRITVWGWVERTSSTSTETRSPDALASLVRAVLVDGVTGLWRVTRGSGRAPGVDPDTELPFCTFTLTAETKPSPVA